MKKSKVCPYCAGLQIVDLKFKDFVSQRYVTCVLCNNKSQLRLHWWHFVIYYLILFIVYVAINLFTEVRMSSLRIYLGFFIVGVTVVPFYFKLSYLKKI